MSPATTPTSSAAPADRAEFQAFVAQHQVSACAVAYSALGDRALSEDVAQEAFLIAWRRMPTLETPVTEPAAWLRGVVRHVAANVQRKRRREVHEMSIIEAQSDPNASQLEHVLGKEDAERAAQALAALPEEYREPLVLFYRGDQSVREVATALGISEDAAKQRLSRGRAQLKERLSGVEQLVRTTRPGLAFTAACVAAYLALGTGTALAAASGATRPLRWLIGSHGAALLAASLATAAAITVGVKRYAQPSVPAIITPAATSTATRSATAPPTALAFAAVPSTPPTPTPVAPPVAGGTSAPAVGLEQRVDLDINQADIHKIIAMLAEASEKPMLVAPGLSALVNARAENTTLREVLDDVLTQAGAHRRDVPGLAVVADPSATASVPAGAPVTLDLKNVSVRDAVKAVVPALAMPVVAAIAEADAHVTVKFEGVPAGEALRQIVHQAGLGLSAAAGYEIVADEE
jgi:RNA polymerase sigma factor (sigma-70 family)